MRNCHGSDGIGGDVSYDTSPWTISISDTAIQTIGFHFPDIRSGSTTMSGKLTVTNIHFHMPQRTRKIAIGFPAVKEHKVSRKHYGFVRYRFFGSIDISDHGTRIPHITGVGTNLCAGCTFINFPAGRGAVTITMTIHTIHNLGT